MIIAIDSPLLTEYHTYNTLFVMKIKYFMQKFQIRTRYFLQQSYSRNYMWVTEYFSTKCWYLPTKFLKDMMRRFFKNRWLNIKILKSMWRCKISNYHRNNHLFRISNFPLTYWLNIFSWHLLHVKLSMHQLTTESIHFDAEYFQYFQSFFSQHC
jgi:hypothetical protein